MPTNNTEDSERSLRKQVKELLYDAKFWTGDERADAEARVDRVVWLLETRKEHYEHTATQRELKARLDELTACLSHVPMPSLSYEQVEGRMAELTDQLKQNGGDDE